MGQLIVDCFDTQETTNTIYAYGGAYDNSKEILNNGIIVLLKSNAAPSSPEALSWTVVSTVRRDNVLYITNLRDSHCIVEPNGAFTVWAFSTTLKQGDSTLKTRPGGFRYDPSLTPTANTTGPGGWANIDIPVDYQWTSSSSSNYLFYLVDAAGKSTVYHAYLSSMTSNTLYFGALNTATNMMENAPVKWAMNLSSSISDLKFSSTTMFLWFSGYPTDSVYTAPLPQGPLTSTPPALERVNYTTTRTCSREASLRNQYFMFCDISQTYGTVYRLYVWDGTSNKTIPVSSPISRTPYSDGPTTIVGDGGTSAFMLAQGGNSRASSSSDKLMAVYVSGPLVGTVQVVTKNITVADDNISDDSKGLTSNRGGSSRGNSDAGILFGIVAAALVVIAALIFCVRSVRRKAASKQAALLLQQQQQDVSKPTVDGGHGFADSAPAGLTYSHQPLHPHVASLPQPVGQPAMSHAAPPFGYPSTMEGGGGGSNIASAQKLPLSDIMQETPNQPFVFSTHPRPTFVTTVGSGNDINSSAYNRTNPILGQEPSAVSWAPMPFNPQTWTQAPNGPSPVGAVAIGASPPTMATHSPVTATVGTSGISVYDGTTEGSMGSPSTFVGTTAAATPVTPQSTTSGTFSTPITTERPHMPPANPQYAQEYDTPLANDPSMVASPPIPTHSRPSNPQYVSD